MKFKNVITKYYPMVFEN